MGFETSVLEIKNIFAQIMLMSAIIKLSKSNNGLLETNLFVLSMTSEEAHQLIFSVKICITFLTTATQELSQLSEGVSLSWSICVGGCEIGN